MTATPDASHAPKRGRRTWFLLAAALAWGALLRVPLVVNAPVHLDSDLAVDGLTLRDAVAGRWRWHYPGTPHMGIVPVLFSFPQAAAWGTGPITLVSGGTVAALGVIAATFVLARYALGPVVAAWSLVPLTFASTGFLWLSARVTGGHLASAAWHATAFALLYGCQARGGRGIAAILGLWCGVGLYVDSLFLMTLAGLVPAAVAGWWASGRSRSGLVAGLCFVAGLIAGVAPREIGARVDPYDAYREQFDPVKDRAVLVQHARILALDCLPRLIAGHRLPGLQADPDPSALSEPGPTRRTPDPHPIALMTTALALLLLVVALGALAIVRQEADQIPSAVVRWGLLLSTAATCAGFVVNRNIFNSDNYRYLVGLVVPWSLGFGLAMRTLCRRGMGGRALAAGCALGLACLTTSDAARWYRQFGWIDPAGRLVRRARPDPALDWLDRHPEVGHVRGGYWDVYRWCFLANRRLRGTPYGTYPDRFPEWSRPSNDADVLIARRTAEGRPFVAHALEHGGRVLDRLRDFLVVSWP